MNFLGEKRTYQEKLCVTVNLALDDPLPDPISVSELCETPCFPSKKWLHKLENTNACHLKKYDQWFSLSALVLEVPTSNTAAL